MSLKQWQSEVYLLQKLKDKIISAAVETIFVKFCETGNNIVPPTSQKIAPVKNRYVLITI